MSICGWSVLGKLGPERFFAANWAPENFCCGKLGPGKFVGGKLGPQKILAANWAPANRAPADWAPEKKIGGKLGPGRLGPGKSGPGKYFGGWMWVRGFGEYTYIKIYNGIGYMLQTIWGGYVSWKHILILNISCQPLGDECKFESSCVPFGCRVGESYS